VRQACDHHVEAVRPEVDRRDSLGRCALRHASGLCCLSRA
jgi:hypothetical protein